MPKAKDRVLLSKKVIDGLQARNAEYNVWDSAFPGFGVRVSPGGARSYIFGYRLGGKYIRMTLGACSKLTPDQARGHAKALAAEVFRGNDPKAQKKAAENARSLKKHRDKELAFNVYCERYLEERVRLEIPNSYRSLRSCLQKHTIGFWKKKPIDEIQRRDVTRLIDHIPADHQSVRNQVYIALSKLFKWAQGRGDIERSPMEGMTPPKKPEKRSRVLSGDELRLVILAARKMDSVFGDFFELLAITGQRRNEVAGLDWSELDRSAAIWTLPATRSKNKAPHIIPLSPMAMTILDRLAGKAGQKAPKWPGSGLLFSTTGSTPISGFSKAKLQLDAAMAELAADRVAASGGELQPNEVPDWRIHDLRRTVATGLQRLGVRLEVNEAVLNHTAGQSKVGVASVYQLHDWKDEKRDALCKWAQHCEQLLAR